MAKFYGKVGYAEMVETAPDVHSEQITEHYHYGELVRNTSKWITSEHLNDNQNIANEISIMADTYAMENFYAIRYVEFMGAKWKVNNVEVKYPRLILSIGGLYNG